MICNDGFLYNETTEQCDSTCQVPCTNGACTNNPYECECNRHFHKNNNGNCIKNECHPRSRDECVHGSCSSNGICECDEGFIKNYDTLACDPICDEECIFGTCTAPNTCTCQQNYQLQNASNRICRPICSVGCANGSCVIHDICICDIGFEYNPEANGCIKISCTTYCLVCQCVDSIFGHSFTPMSVTKPCYTIMLATTIVIIILCLFLVFSYRRYINRINRPFNPSILRTE